MYFGPNNMPQSQEYFDAHTSLAASFVLNASTGFHSLGNGNVWKVLKDPSFEVDSNQVAFIYGNPYDVIECDFGVN